MSKLAAEVKTNGWPAAIKAALIGSLHQLLVRGHAARGPRRHAGASRRGSRRETPFLVTPGSERIYQTIKRDGIMATFEQMGGTVLANACGPCIGQWKRSDVGKDEANTIVSSFNRNFPGRNDGSAGDALLPDEPGDRDRARVRRHARVRSGPRDADRAGRQAVPLHPARGRGAPARGLRAGRGRLRGARGRRRARSQVVVRPDSERLQLLQPFPRWDGKDFDRLPILVKTKGKTTTDHISPAGAWLRFRGHLDKISDNMFLGALNAFTGEAGQGRQRPDRRDAACRSPGSRGTGRPRARAGSSIGDENYGEGSSREHAAMSPRYLGAKVVLVKSFARIHETNLKKQGILPLTFANPKDYDLFEQADRVSVVGLQALAPGRPVEVRIHKPDGRTVTIQTRHSLTEEHIGWFRAGSALNALS